MHKKNKKIIGSIEYPVNNHYFEQDSADGFAFLGTARALANLDYKDCYDQIIQRDCTLHADYACGIHKVLCPKGTKFAYTAWACCEFARVIGDTDLINRLAKTIESIGLYPNGMQKYCSVDIEYLVPNVSASAALVFAMNGQIDKANKLIDVLVSYLDPNINNWKYMNMKDDTYVREEDPYHLAMIIYCLKEADVAYGLNTQDIVALSMERLEAMWVTRPGYRGRAGWGPPMIYMACKNLNKDIAKKALDITTQETIVAPNFRARAIAAWALSNS